MLFKKSKNEQKAIKAQEAYTDPHGSYDKHSNRITDGQKTEIVSKQKVNMSSSGSNNATEMIGNITSARAIHHNTTRSNQTEMIGMEQPVMHTGPGGRTEIIGMEPPVMHAGPGGRTEIIGMEPPVVHTDSGGRTEIIGLMSQNFLHTLKEKTDLCNKEPSKQDKTEVCIEKLQDPVKTELNIRHHSSGESTELASAKATLEEKTEVCQNPDILHGTDIADHKVAVQVVNVEAAETKSKQAQSLSLQPDNKQVKPRKPVQKASFILRLLDKENGGRVFEKVITDVLIIGRKSELCDLAISYDKTISSRQCKVFIKRGKLYVTDLGGTNMTYLNGKPLSEEAPLSTGDVLSLGRINLRATVTKNG